MKARKIGFPPKIGVVIPTLFEREDYLHQCIDSVRRSGNVHILLMGPSKPNAKPFIGKVDQFLEEPISRTLSSKIDVGLTSLPSEVEFFTWIGDDDLLEAGSMTLASRALIEDKGLGMVFGACRYIDANGESIGMNKSGQWALTVMKFGPFLAPQPGSLYRRESYNAVKGLNRDLELAFDYDLTYKLASQGRVLYLDKVLASYRWHPGALSVNLRRESASEAARVRLEHCDRWARPLIRVINPLLVLMTVFAGVLTSALTMRGKAKAAKKTRAK